MAVVLSLMVMVSPALAVESGPVEEPAEVTEPLTSETTPRKGETGEETPVTPAGPRHPGAGDPRVPPPPRRKPEDTTPDQSLPEGIALRQDHVAYMAGFPGGTFQPETQLTRAQAADPVPPAGRSGQRHRRLWVHRCGRQRLVCPATRALCALGIFDNGAFFRPNDVITRAEFVALLLRVNPQEGGDGHLPRRARHPLGGPGHRGSCRPGLDRRLPRWDLPSGEWPDPGRGLRGAQPDAGPDGGQRPGQ